jgi:branched-chain amino acid transport system ATP-binding protein
MRPWPLTSACAWPISAARMPNAPSLGKVLLNVANLDAWYGDSHVLHGVNFEVRAGEVVSLLGRNGAGKTTTLKSIMGIVGRRTGSVIFEGKETIKLASNAISRLGIQICPEERAIFTSLSVDENLEMPPAINNRGLSRERIFSLFPNLKERLHSGGGNLSGGEQQMLAIARILRTGAQFLMLDEPTEGLAPAIVEQIAATIEKLKSEDFTILLGEQSIAFATPLADRFYIVADGSVVDQFDRSGLARAEAKLKQYLGL